jgi:hypothetical protein
MSENMKGTWGTVKNEKLCHPGSLKNFMLFCNVPHSLQPVLKRKFLAGDVAQ